MFKNMKVGMRLGLGFCVVLLLMIGIIYSAMRSLIRISIKPRSFSFPRSAWEREKIAWVVVVDCLAEDMPDKTIQARSARWRFQRVWEVFAGNASSRYRSNRLIPAYMAVVKNSDKF